MNEDWDWIQLPDVFKPRPGLFIAQVIGDSMNRRIPNGAWCLFSANPVGTREGKVVVVEHRRIDDPDTGSHVTVKIYHSEKIPAEDGEWRHSRIVLKPDSTDRSYRPIVLDPSEFENLRVLAELVAVLA